MNSAILLDLEGTIKSEMNETIFGIRRKRP